MILRHIYYFLNVYDFDHKDNDRSNNSYSNCQALCPICHAIKTRKKKRNLTKSLQG